MRVSPDKAFQGGFYSALSCLKTFDLLTDECTSDINERIRCNKVHGVMCRFASIYSSHCDLRRTGRSKIHTFSVLTVPLFGLTEELSVLTKESLAGFSCFSLVPDVLGVPLCIKGSNAQNQKSTSTNHSCSEQNGSKPS